MTTQLLAIVEAFLAGTGTAQKRGALKETTIPHEIGKEDRTHGRQRNMGQKWSEVVAASGPTTHRDHQRLSGSRAKRCFSFLRMLKKLSNPFQCMYSGAACSHALQMCPVLRRPPILWLKGLGGH